jgi:hypothetical protein
MQFRSLAAEQAPADVVPPSFLPRMHLILSREPRRIAGAPLPTAAV